MRTLAISPSHFATVLGNKPVVVVSPDVGGVKRAEAFEAPRVWCVTAWM
jgi:hypothetical protein